jgi:hypothetical protein
LIGPFFFLTQSESHCTLKETPDTGPFYFWTLSEAHFTLMKPKQGPLLLFDAVPSHRHGPLLLFDPVPTPDMGPFYFLTPFEAATVNQHPPAHHEGMNDKWLWNNFLLGSSSLAIHGGYLSYFFFPYLPTNNSQAGC